MRKPYQFVYVATIDKITPHELRVTLENDMDTDVVSLNLWFKHDNNEMEEGCNPLKFYVDYLPQVIEALQAAKLKAEQLGVLDPA